MNEIKIFSPATIANISCGFDILGCCLNDIGDEMVVRKSNQPGITISKIEGIDLPLEAKNNVAGAAGFALLNSLREPIHFGFDIEIYKNIKPGSGIGSSAASAAGAVFALNALLNYPFTENELIQFAREGERLACGSPIADNVAPALLGGFTLVHSTDPLQIIQLPSIDKLYVSIIHPQIEVKTSDARAILPQQVALKDAIKQWGNVGSLVHALHTNDIDLFGQSLHDYIVEPYRSQLIPSFEEVKKASLNAGALGCGISGSGPSLFAFSKSESIAKKVSQVMEQTYLKTQIPFFIYNSTINQQGIKILNQK